MGFLFCQSEIVLELSNNYSSCAFFWCFLFYLLENALFWIFGGFISVGAL
jgi:hypothetical protein